MGFPPSPKRRRFLIRFEKGKRPGGIFVASGLFMIFESL
jgi:hypothetical protein